MLGIGGSAGLTLAAAALLLFPPAVPVLASALAGLIAIAAFAQLALIRIVVGFEVQAGAPTPDVADSLEPCRITLDRARL